ncbi:forkhead box protein N2 [Rana temporaria]|uniref:forkhead box protein N2 n=1 Tax=Rana temporaria TaxID=8407 RepID=UPI001AAD0DEB|nr:forkhead box protein N2 [Rana temporaria]
MGPVTGMTPDKNVDTPGAERAAGLSQIDTMGSLPEEVGAARPKASAVDCGPADEELTNLNWLHESTNLLNNFSLGSEGLAANNPLYDIEGDNSPSGCRNAEKSSASSKPPYSFSLLIYMAIEHSPNKCLPVKEIYSWILDRFPYFATAPTGWKNSVRHNLSLNKCFQKVERSHGKVNGKGSLWCVDPEYKPNLVQALKKQPFSAALALYTPPASPTSASPPHCLSSALKQTQGHAVKDSDIDAATAMMLLNSSIKHDASDCVCCTIKENVKIEGADGQKPQPHKAVLPKKRNYSSAFKHCASLSLQESDSTVTNIDPKEDHNYSASGTDSQRCESRSSVSSLSSVDEVYEFIPKNSRAGSDGSEGFHSEDDTDMDYEEDALGDSGYAAQPCINSSKEQHGKKLRKEACQDIDDELKEAAGSLLHLAGIRTCLDSLLKTAKAQSQKHRK